MLITSSDVISLIISWQRVGCDPFEFISKELFEEFEYYELRQFDWQSDFIKWDSVKGYGTNYKNRIDKKVKNKNERYKYYKVYEKDIPPVILNDEGYPLDGYHRLAKFKKDKLSFKGYVGIRS